MRKLDEETKRRLKRRLHRRRKDALALGQQADQKIERLLIRRFDRLASVRRFVGLWILLFLLLILVGIYQTRNLSVYYQALRPAPGGLYTEGVVGAFTNANPLYATSAADTAVSRLVFSGLFKYDTHNKLVGDLAQGYSLSQDQTHYSVHLKQNVRWQDGVPFTANDVVYTYRTIQNIEAQSPLYASWQGIKVTQDGPYTVNFDLPNALSDFPYSLTNGIVPSHLLRHIPADQLRSAPFNSQPVGTGPFVWKFIETTGDVQDQQQRISLAANKDYYSGPPKLDGFNLITFSGDQQMIDAFSAKQINAMGGLEDVPDQFKGNNSVRVYVTPLTAEVMAFFNNSQPMLNDANVRRALVEGADRSQFRDMFDEPVLLAGGPLLRGQLGFDSQLVEPPFNQTAAEQQLSQDGWVPGKDGVRTKNGQALSLSMSAQDTPNYTKAAQFLQRQWAKLGVQLQVHYFSADELQASVISNHDYDILLYGISIGVDPDVYAYWDSSQASITSQGHLNLSEYKSKVADQAVEAGRTRADPAIRAVKYKTFLAQWTKDLPAMALYQPNDIYISRGPVYNYQRNSANSNADRYYNVADWMIRQKRQTIN